jgi:hypothetical protein
MKRYLLFLLVCYSSSLLKAQTPTVEWVKAFGGIGNERPNGVTTDTAGNIIVVGRFQSSSITLDSITLTKSAADHPDMSDLFMIKLDKKGNALWAITAGNLGDDHALSCVTDQKGNIYVVGYFESKMLSFGRETLHNNNFTIGKDSVRYNSDMWLAKFSPDGTCIWARNAGGLDGNGQYSTITLDRSNHVIISGIAGGEMNFGKGTKLIQESTGIYVAKYSNDGDLLWVKSPNGKGEAQGVGTDPEGNIFIGGYFNSTISFGPIALQSHSEKNSDAFVAKYAPDGNILWARSIGGDNGEIASCEADPFGNVYLSGLYFSKTIYTETDTLKNNGSINHFIAKYNKDGQLLWARSAGGNNGEEPGTATREFYVDHDGNAFCTGSNWSAFSFAGQSIRSVSGSEDMVLLKYDKDGKEIWALDYGGTGRNAGRGISTDANGFIYLTGSFEEKHLKIENHTLMNAGSSDIVIIKFKETKK